MAEKFFRQNNWSGGWADSDNYGTAGSFSEGYNIDIRSEPGTFTLNQALSQGTIITELPRYGLKCSSGTYYFFGSKGTIYSRDSSGAYGTVYRDSYGTITGCGELDNYIYWITTDGTISRIATGSSWSADVSHDWGTLSKSEYHQTAKNGLYLFILNDRYVATVDDTGTLTVDGTPDIALNQLPSNYQYTTISNFGIDLVLGTKETVGVDNARIFRWDTVSATWNSHDDIPEQSINCFIPVNDYVLAQCGNQGRIYYYDGSALEKWRKIKGDYENKSMTANPASVCQFQGVGLLGVSNSSENPCKEGIFSIGQYDRNYPLSLNFDYTVSSGSVAGVEIGALLSSGTLLCVPWKYSAGSCYIDEIDWGAKAANGTLTTLKITGDREKQKQFQKYNVSYKNNDGTISLSTSDGTTITLQSQSKYRKLSAMKDIEGGEGQFSIGLTANGNDSPIVEEFYTSWNEREVL